jgi:glycine hydroxymethyltransferase
MNTMEPVSKALCAVDPEVAAALNAEHERETTKLIMIASENYASDAVREAQGSLLTNKYAEGYPGKRYYQGCGPADSVEQLAIDRLKKMYGCEHANVQPHAGSQANMAVYFTLIQPGDTILGMSLAAGGHLTHGTAMNFSGMLYKAAFYGVQRQTERLDFDEIRAQARACKPRIIVAGASAYPRVIDFTAFREIADEVGAYLLVDMAHIAGLVATGAHPSPVPMADAVTSTTHKTLRGPRGGIVLCRGKYGKEVDKMVFPGLQGGPFMHSIAAKAVAFHEALQPSFKLYQEYVVKNAQALAAALLSKGYTLVTGGTDNHLLLVNLNNKGVTGKDAAAALDQAGIVVNKNGIPFDDKSPFVTSGIRIGTPALTTRGMREADMAAIARWIDRVVMHHADPDVMAAVRAEVREFTADFPLFKA